MTMQIQINTDNTIEGHEQIAETLEATIGEGLSRFSEKITRVELHLSDVNGDRGGNDKRCVLEVRPKGLLPVITSSQAASVDQAVRSAIQKMFSLLGSTFGKQWSRN